MRKRKLHKRYGTKRRSETSDSPRSRLRHNPPLFTELAEFVVPGFAGFAATRFLTRVAATQIAKRKPEWAKHAGAVASVGSFLAAWFGVQRVKQLEKYHTPIVVGSAIAAIQSVIQLYIPKLGWMIADASPQIAEESASSASQSLSMPVAPDEPQLPPGLTPTTDDPAWYTYDDQYDAGRYSRMTGPSPKGAQSSQTDDTSDDAAMMDDLNVDASDGMGIFGNA